MFKGIFGAGSRRPTSKSDVVMAVAAALIGVWKATDVVKDYRHENEENEK